MFRKGVIRGIKGFTLTELLFVLILIGVISLLLLNPLIAYWKNQRIIAGLKEDYSIISQAVMNSMIYNGNIQDWGWHGMGEKNGGEVVFEKILPFLRIQKYCGATGEGCTAKKNYLLNGDYKQIHGSADYITFRLANGSSGFFEVLDPTCSTVRGDLPKLQSICGVIWIDANGGEAPNTYGKDIFGFYVSKHGIMPRGVPEETVGNNNFEKSCNYNSSRKGFGCAAWVLYRGNTDYLKKKVYW